MIVLCVIVRVHATYNSGIRLERDEIESFLTTDFLAVYGERTKIS